MLQDYGGFFHAVETETMYRYLGLDPPPTEVEFQRQHEQQVGGMPPEVVLNCDYTETETPAVVNQYLESTPPHVPEEDRQSGLAVEYDLMEEDRRRCLLHDNLRDPV